MFERLEEVPMAEMPMAGPIPRRFTWEGRAYVVADVLGHWVTGTPWWRTPAEPDEDTHTWRIEASSGPRSGIYDLSCSGDRWSLRRMA